MKAKIIPILLILTAIPFVVGFGEGEFDYSELPPYLTDIVAIDPDDGMFIVGNGTDWVGENLNTARTSLELGTSNSPQFTLLSLGNVAAANDSFINFYGSTNSGRLTYDQSDNHFETVAGFQSGTTAVAGHIYTTPQPDTIVALNINGQTQDYTSNILGETIQAQRDLNRIEGGSVPAFIGIKNEVNIKHTHGHLIPNTYYWGSNARIVNTATLLENTSGTFDRQLQESAFVGNVGDTATYDTLEDMEIDILSVGLQSTQNISPTIQDTGGTSPANTLIIKGVDVGIESAPTITSGELDVKTYGLYIDTDVDDVPGVASTSYGIFINEVSGADTMYSVWDATGEAWNIGASDFDTTGTITATTLAGANAEWDAAYGHSIDNTQAHTDYLINNGNDSMNGVLTATGLSVIGGGTIVTINVSGIAVTGGGADISTAGDVLCNDVFPTGIIRMDNFEKIQMDNSAGGVGMEMFVYTDNHCYLDIESNASNFYLRHQNATKFFIENTTGHIGIANEAPTVQLDVTGAITGSGVVTGASLITGGNIGIAADADVLSLAANEATVNGDLVVNGSTTFTGAAGLIFGSCYGSGIDWSQVGAAQNTWYNISDADIIDGQLNGVTHDDSGELTVTEPGMYLVTWDCTFQSTVPTNDLYIGVEVNDSGSADPAGQAYFAIRTMNTDQHLSGSCILDLADNSTIELAIKITTISTPTLTVNAMNLTCTQVGGT